MIYKRGLETVAKRYTGPISSETGSNSIQDTRPEEVIGRVLGNSGPIDNPNGIRAGPGRVFIYDGIYTLSSSFSGFNLRSYTSLIAGPQSVLRVPSGYSGYAFRLQSSRGRKIRNCVVDGGIIEEMDPPKRKWVGILLHGMHDGVAYNKFMNTNINNAGIGIQLKATSNRLSSTGRNYGIEGGWVNANSFESLKMSANNVFVDFVMEGPYRPHKTGIDRNYFANVECQCGSNTEHGIRNIRHIGNTFIGVNVWDIHNGGSGVIISNIYQEATGTNIISGMMTGQNFVDRGKNTKIIN